LRELQCWMLLRVSIMSCVNSFARGLENLNFRDVSNRTVAYPFDDAANVFGEVACESGVGRNPGMHGSYFHHCARFIDRMRQRLLAIRVLAHLYRCDSREGVRMIGGTNYDRVDSLLHVFQHDAPVVITLHTRILDELSRASLCPVPSMTVSGKPAYLFSSFPKQTIEKHFEWMREYEIDGALLRRFVGSIPGQRFPRPVLLPSIKPKLRRDRWHNSSKHLHRRMRSSM